MVCSGLMRPSDGYLLLAPCGPVWSKLRASEMTLPLRTRRAAATMSSAVVWFRVPISSCGPHLPQFLYFSAASRRSCRVSFLMSGLLLLAHDLHQRAQGRGVGAPAQALHLSLIHISEPTRLLS